MLPFLLVVIVSTATSQSSAAQYDQVWRVIPGSVKELETVLKLQKDLPKIDFWKEPTSVGRSVDFKVCKSDIVFMTNLLHHHKLHHDIMIADIEKLIQRHRKRRSVNFEEVTFENFDYEIYHPPEEIDDWIDLVAGKFDFINKFQIGVTYEGRAIYALNISRSQKPTIYIDSLIHSREWITGAATLFAFKEILTNDSYSWMLDDVNWIFVPQLNIDGYKYSWTPDNRLWRKTMSEQASPRCVGTDANRNFNDHWNDRAGSSIEPCSNTFRGPFAESESETRHVARFINAHNDVIKAVVTVHSYAQVIIYPYNYELEAYPHNNDEQNRTAAAMSKAMYDLYQTVYEFGPAAETLGVATGVTTDWSQDSAGIDINYTIELRDTGEFGFLLPEDQIVPTGEELLAGLKVLAEHIDTKYNKT